MAPPTPEYALAPDTLAEVADLRARGHSWESTARAVGWEAAELRRAVRGEPEYARFYEEAAREVRQEVEAEMLVVFRTQLHDQDAVTAREAADALARHLAGERRDRTRIEVEKLRAETAHARIEAKRPEAEPEDESRPAPELTPEEVHRPNTETLFARRAADELAVVWLWGAGHKIGGVGPDAATDTPLVLFADDTVPGMRKVYWAARYPLPTHPTDGPFPAPSDEVVPELTAEQAEQLRALAKTGNVGAA